MTRGFFCFRGVRAEGPEGAMLLDLRRRNGEDAEYRGGEGLSPPEDRLAVSWPAVFLCLPNPVGYRAMRRLLHILSNTAAVLSLLLFIGIVVLWARSYWVREVLTRAHVDYNEQFLWKDTWDLWIVGGGLKIDGFKRRELTARERELDSRFDEDHHQRGTFYFRRVGYAKERLWKYPRSVRELQDADILVDAPVDGGDRGWFKFLGFKAGWSHQDGDRMQSPKPGRLNTDREVIIPLWFITALAGVLPAVRLRRALRRRRIRRANAAGTCSVCGYDLRASPDRCPECGAVSATLAPAARLLGRGG